MNGKTSAQVITKLFKAISVSVTVSVTGISVSITAFTMHPFYQQIAAQLVSSTITNFQLQVVFFVPVLS